MPTVGLKPLEYAEHLLGWLTIRAIRHQFGIAQDGVERRAQLVAHIGEELRLVLARFFKLPALVLDFVKQSNILDRYHCLVGESRYKLYLLRIAWFYDFSAVNNDANRFSLTQERYAKMRAKAAQFRDIVFGIRKDIRDLDWLSLQQNSARYTSAPRRKCEVLNEVRVFRRECKVGRRIESLLFRPHNLRHIGFTQPRSRLC